MKREDSVAENELCFKGAVELTRLIRTREVSAREVMAAHLARIDRINPVVNAIVSLIPEQALAGAEAVDRALAQGLDPGPLAGLPVAHKDLLPTQGLRTTYGSPIFKDYVPDHDALIVARQKAAGAICLGKTNTPEFGAGSQTFNQVFGATRNPYDLTKTCGGSSGGAAVALAMGMIALADGSDLGGSLRNPANFCNVVGLRPSPGRVPSWPKTLGWFPLVVVGPMARSVTDLAFLLSAVAGPDPRDPTALSEPGGKFAPPLGRDFKGTRVAFSPDLGGLPVDRRVREVLIRQRSVFENLGCIVEEATPDLTDADDIFQVLRAYYFEARWGKYLDSHRHLLKDTVVWNIEAGRALTGARIGRAEADRTRLFHRVREFMEAHEFLVLPVNQVPPFDVDQPYITEIEGVALETYIDWMKSCYHITVTGLPAISVPAGFTAEGLPVGIQIVGRHRDDRGVLELAHAFEQATGVGEWRRFDPRLPG